MEREQFVALLADVGCYNRLQRDCETRAEYEPQNAETLNRLALEWRNDRNNTIAKLLTWFDSLENSK